MNFGIKKAVVVSLATLMAVLYPGLSVKAAEPVGITVSAAISLKDAFEEIGKTFEAVNRGVKVGFNFGASGDLKAQIRGGAPVDVFASAAEKDMDDLVKEGLVLTKTKIDFAANSLVLIAPASSKLAIASFADLTKPEVKKIAVGNPETVPAGRYTYDVFHSLKIYDAIKDKCILAENVRQVLDYTARDEVDAGVVYMTDAITRPDQVKVVVTAPADTHKPIRYPIAVVKGSQKVAVAKKFVAFIISDAGQKILKAHGFQSAQDSMRISE